VQSLARQQWVALLALGGLLVACGGRANSYDDAAAGAANAVAGSSGRSDAGHGGVAAAPDRGGAATAAGDGGVRPGGGEGGDGAAAGAGGALAVRGSGHGGDTIGVGGQGAGGDAGAGSGPASIEVLVGDYDVYLASPPVVAGCSVAWYEPRINLTMYQADSGKLAALPYADFFWHANFDVETKVSANTVQLAASLDWADSTLTPALDLSWGADGFVGPGSAVIPYDCEEGATTTRTVVATIEADHTSPKLRVDPDSYGTFAFTRFGFTFSEPVDLPSGDYGITFEEPADAEQVVELYDLSTNAALPTAWKWSLAGPIAQAHFLDLPSVEGRTIAARLIATVTDHAGNPLVALAKTFDIAPAALLETELDFDQAPPVGLYGNASFHATAEPGAACEQGGCLVLDGPVAQCYDAPHSTFAVRVASPWDDGIDLRYRVWASSSWVSPLEIGFASGCSGSFSTALSPLAQADGPFTHVSDWKTVTLHPCGGPENEDGFALSLACAEDGPPPAVRVVVERLTRR
jgi:hypothetical protein